MRVVTRLVGKPLKCDFHQGFPMRSHRIPFKKNNINSQPYFPSPVLLCSCDTRPLENKIL